MNQPKSSQAQIAFLLAALTGAIVSGTSAKLMAQTEESTTTTPSFEAAPADNAKDSETLQDPEPSIPEDSSNQDNSPYDYESSEEISEDRSVSFPVDI